MREVSSSSGGGVLSEEGADLRVVALGFVVFFFVVVVFFVAVIGSLVVAAFSVGLRVRGAIRGCSGVDKGCRSAGRYGKKKREKMLNEGRVSR